MCIILHFDEIEKTGIDFDAIAAGYANNPDGAGFTFIGDKTRSFRGYFKASELIDAIERNRRESDTELVVHCRISTAGLVDTGNCHPFPIVSKTDIIRSLDRWYGPAFFHNGIIGQGHGDLSDTALFVRDTLARLQLHKSRRLEYAYDLIESHALNHNSKYLLIDDSGVSYRFGNWTHEKKLGFYASNSYGYTERYSYSSKYTDSWWENYYDERDAEENIGRYEYCPICKTKYWCPEDKKTYYCKPCRYYLASKHELEQIEAEYEILIADCQENGSELIAWQEFARYYIEKFAPELSLVHGRGKK